jgi:hypothetical protein
LNSKRKPEEVQNGRQEAAEALGGARGPGDAGLVIVLALDDMDQGNQLFQFWGLFVNADPNHSEVLPWPVSTIG